MDSETEEIGEVIADWPTLDEAYEIAAKNVPCSIETRAFNAAGEIVIEVTTIFEHSTF